MKRPTLDELGHMSMLEIFRVEAETQSAILTSGLLTLERHPGARHSMDVLMRAAHSLKGAARIVNLQGAVRVAHAIEDCLAAAQHGGLQLGQNETDLLLRSVDFLLQLAKPSRATAAERENANGEEIQRLLGLLKGLLSTTEAPPHADKPGASSSATADHAAAKKPMVENAFVPATAREYEAPERVVRLNAENLNRLLGLAGESLVESRWLRPFADSLQRLRRHQADLSEKLDELRSHLHKESSPERAEESLNALYHKVTECQEVLADRLQELELFDRRSSQLSQRLYLEALRTRMRPFGDGTRRFPRMVRDLARALNKDIRLEIIGQNTQVDRDILERLETPLAHLLRNAVDHGCETREQRQHAGKPSEGTIRLEARHSAGMLLVTVSDDGAGVNLERVRHAVVRRNLALAPVAEKLNESELLEFLFAPGFTLKETVTEISGRGVGLDVVQNMVRSVRGSLRINSQLGGGLRVQLQLPLTLSVVRALLVDVAAEPYAIPLTQITRTLKLRRDRIESIEGRHHFKFRGQPIGLLTAHQVLGRPRPRAAADDLPVVVLGDRNARYGLIVDRFLGQGELVVQPLDARLGKVRNVNAAALMEDGSPVLIIDIDDILRSVESFASGGILDKGTRSFLEVAARGRKRVLAVDDSSVVRELQQELLTRRGYVVDVAADGRDAWNILRAGQYDLLITDVDMPRMGGIELATSIKQDPQLRSLPVMIVSHLDSERDRQRGLEAGADYYLTKGSFQDDTLIQAVVDLIGEPNA
jgi:two-component system sensor histidine kinase and response regulator WspE